MARKDNDDILYMLTQLPWWCSVVFSIIVYVFIRFLFPAIAEPNFILSTFANSFSKFSWLAFVFLVPGLISFLDSKRKRELLDRQTSIDSIRSLSWKQFEELIGEAFRRRGYSVSENYKSGADDGIDLILKKDGTTYIVQCKNWRDWKVDVKVVREMYGIMTAKHADAVIIVCSGKFTEPAQDFARDKPMELINGIQLMDMIRVAQPNLIPRSLSGQIDDIDSEMCPECGSILVVRTARRGSNIGSKFWGCSDFPNCRFTKEM